MSEITLYVSKQTLPESVWSDVATVLILGGPVVLNELTLQSAVLNFLLGCVGLLIVFGRVMAVANKTRIRGKTADEVVAKVRARLSAND